MSERKSSYRSKPKPATPELTPAVLEHQYGMMPKAARARKPAPIKYGTMTGARARASANDVHAPAANTAAVITYAADATRAHAINGVYWSYSGAPAAGNLKIEDGSGVVVYTTDITAGGPGFLPIEKLGTPNTALIITLAAGGAGITGKVCVGQHWIQ